MKKEKPKVIHGKHSIKIDGKEVNNGLCNCENPDPDGPGRFNCGGAFIMFCRKCEKTIKWGKEDYSHMRLIK